MRAFFYSTCSAGLRGHSFHLVFILGLMLVGTGYLAALFSPRQPGTVGLDVGFSGMHFASVFLALIWIQELVGKEIQQRTTNIYLAYPIPRADYILGRFLGITLLLLTASIIFGMLLWIESIAAGSIHEQSRPLALGTPFWVAVFGVWLSAVLVAAFSLCIATLSTTPALPIALGAAFAIAGHSLGAVVDYLEMGAYGQKDLVDHYGPTIQFAKLIIPDLSRLDWRIWPMYDIDLPDGLLSLSCLMAICYTMLILGIAVMAFSRREFD